MTLYLGLSTAPAHVKLEAFFGIGQETQRRVGTLILLTSMVEMQIESVTWLLTGEVLGDDPPATERMQTSDILKLLRKAATERVHPPELEAVLQSAVDAAEDLLVVRHTIAHGRPLAPSSTGGAPHLVRNPTWLGEKRRRPTTTLPLSDTLLEQAAEIADAVFKAMGQVASAVTGILPAEVALGLSPSVQASRNRVATIRAELERSLGHIGGI